MKATPEMRSCRSTRFGGYLADIPLPLIRKSNVGLKRRVEVVISTYRGFSPGAVHYYVRANVEKDWIWDRILKIWVAPWDDKEESDRSKSFTSITSARRYAKELTAKYPPKSFTVTLRDCEKTDEGLGEGG